LEADLICSVKGFLKIFSVMKNILVTGVNGFVGSHLFNPALMPNSYLRGISRQNLFLPQNSNLATIRIDNIDAETNWSEALDAVDVVIHLAARAHMLNDAAKNPEVEFDRTNHQGTANLVRQAITANVKHFIFISSIGAMTTLSDRTLNETTPCHPDTPYGRSKLKAEEALISLASRSAMTWTILRPTLVYGPGNPGNMERLLKLVKRRLPLPLGAIDNRRSFIYVENLVDAIVQCIDHPKAINQTFILSDGIDLSTPQLIRRLASCLDYPTPLLPFPPLLMKVAGKLTGKSDTVSRLLGSLAVDSSKIRQTLNWQPPYTLDQGLQATADWFKASSS
jgi:nucleoside-diphosphate-sugar epimerase